MMTREEARIELQAMKDTFEEYEPGGSRCQMALKVALSALRPVSREQVERMFPGCPGCDSVSSKWEIRFCPFCGKPRTDEAVQMVMERLEALYGQENT